jgi:hypothetical protein
LINEPIASTRNSAEMQGKKKALCKELSSEIWG